jgi:hypothetical protein
MSRHGNKANDDWSYYDDTRVSSIYLTVYKKVLERPQALFLKQSVIDKMNGTTVASCHMVRQDSYYEWVPTVEFHLAIPGRANFIKTSSCRTPEIHIRLDPINFAPSEEEILALFEENVGDGKPIHMHGLMSMYSVKGGTKGNKNKFVPWFLNKILQCDEMTTARTENESRLVRDASRYITDSAYNEEYLKERNRVGKMGIIKQLQNLKHLPLETIREALREFLCMDVMDGFDD